MRENPRTPRRYIVLGLVGAAILVLGAGFWIGRTTVPVDKAERPFLPPYTAPSEDSEAAERAIEVVTSISRSDSMTFGEFVAARIQKACPDVDSGAEFMAAADGPENGTFVMFVFASAAGACPGAPSPPIHLAGIWSDTGELFMLPPLLPPQTWSNTRHPVRPQAHHEGSWLAEFLAGLDP